MLTATLSGNYEHLKFFAKDRRVGDFSLNVANHLTADYFKNRFGLERVTAGYDLNVQQLDASYSPTRRRNGSRSPSISTCRCFTLEHCVFCAFLSKGKDYHGLRSPCDKHDVRPPRPHRRATSAQNRRGLSQHRVQPSTGADRRGICGAAVGFKV